MERLFVASGYVRPGERLRAGLGAALGLLVTGLVGGWFHRRYGVPLGLIAPLGASSVLLFAVPASPLAQPWSIVGGNLIAACIGVAAAAAVPHPVLAAGLGVGGAIIVMASLRCLHPPSGAVALTAVLGAGQGAAPGGFILWSVMANSLLLLACAVAFHRVSGHAYPAFLQAAPAPAAREGATARAVSEVLEAGDEVLDISSTDLRTLYDRISLRLAAAPHAGLDCRALMTRAPEALSPDMPLAEAYEAVLRASGHALPVTDESARPIGLLTLADFVARANLTGERVRVAFSRRLRNAARLRSAPQHVVGDIMQRTVICVQAEDPAARALVALAERALPLVPVLGGGRRIIGVITAQRALEQALRSAPPSS